MSRVTLTSFSRRLRNYKHDWNASEIRDSASRYNAGCRNQRGGSEWRKLRCRNSSGLHRRKVRAYPIQVITLSFGFFLRRISNDILRWHHHHHHSSSSTLFSACQRRQNHSDKAEAEEPDGVRRWGKIDERVQCSNNHEYFCAIGQDLVGYLFDFLLENRALL